MKQKFARRTQLILDIHCSLQITTNKIVYKMFSAMFKHLNSEMCVHFGIDSVENLGLLIGEIALLTDMVKKTISMSSVVLIRLVSLYFYCVCLSSVCCICSVLFSATTKRRWTKAAVYVSAVKMPTTLTPVSEVCYLRLRCWISSVHVSSRRTYCLTRGRGRWKWAISVWRQWSPKDQWRPPAIVVSRGTARYSERVDRAQRCTWAPNR